MTMTHHATAALLGIVLLPPLAGAAGFDCDRASTPVEHAICTDTELDALDARLADHYRAAQAGRPPAEREALRQAQRRWLAARNRCGPDRTCLREHYQQRLEALAPPRAQLTHSGPHYQLEASYPRFAGAAEAINRAVREYVQDQVDGFLARTEERLAEPEPPLGPAWSFALEGEAGHRTEWLQVIVFEGYEYDGGAHGMPLLAPLLLDLTTARPLDPAALFRTDSAWLQRLARHSRAALAERDLLGADSDWIHQGTAPVSENYQWLLPGPDGLTVIFPPYAVAPYAAGAQRVLIPYGEIDDLLARPMRAD
ncbi:DUF3298 domain-containing protein [Marichromatium bheemlicum]|uniref:DUF3298 domain-containing protein n=1 Tax=Marichromatium bheemlicum TaxID=365339 RepID=A0ABX1I6V3_9GAMM|nr:DUF3298 domain-containing protein [Marichromatium bheemlicum]NKN31950.1 DUF3298 domain-containing protein [Marichromatium bheemlicum]